MVLNVGPRAHKWAGGILKWAWRFNWAWGWPQRKLWAWGPTLRITGIAPFKKGFCFCFFLKLVTTFSQGLEVQLDKLIIDIKSSVVIDILITFLMLIKILLCYSKVLLKVMGSDGSDLCSCPIDARPSMILLDRCSKKVHSTHH